MKCPKCGYNSFEYLESCKKCGREFEDFRSRFNLRSLLFPARGATAAPVLAEELAEIPPAGALSEADEPESAEESVDFGYDFMDEETPAAPASQAPAEADEFELDWSDQTVGQDEKKQAAAEGPFSATEDEFDFGAREPAETPADQSLGADFSFEDATQSDAFSFDDEGDEEEDLTRESQPQASASGEFSFEEEDEASGQEFDLSWDEEPLPDLSLEEKKDPAVDLSPGADDVFALDSPENDPESPASGAQDAAITLPDLDLDALDFEGLGEDEAANEEKDEKKTKETKGATEEGPSDPFDRKESSARQEAPLQAAGADTLLPGFCARLGAFWVDMVLVMGTFLLFLMAGTRLLSPPGQAGLLPTLQAVLAVSVPYYLLFFLLCFAYFTVFHFWFGQTPGKMFFGLRLEASDGGTLHLSEAFLHTVGGLASLLVLGAGFIIALLDPQGRGWNDRLAGTRLVFTPLEEEA